MVSKGLLRLISSVNRRRMKLLLGIALLAYAASVWGNFVNMSFLLNRSIQENGELKLESKIEEIVEPLREKIRDLEKSFTQKYPPVKFLSEKDRKRILITGGAGFVGSHLTDKLMMDGHEVTVVDNFFTGRKRNVEHWIGHENFELINHDVVEPLYIEVDQIYHLASPASPPNYMYNPIKTLKTNTIGTLNMLGLAKRVGARLLLASTSEVYGDPEVHPQSEDYWGHVNPIGPRACYDEGKRVAETMCYAYMKQTKRPRFPHWLYRNMSWRWLGTHFLPLTSDMSLWLCPIALGRAAESMLYGQVRSCAVPCIFSLNFCCAWTWSSGTCFFIEAGHDGKITMSMECSFRTAMYRCAVYHI
ncbi:UDP-glucuronic acid decarboxylase 1 isoform X3 [Onychomys torridus]|uniref:UDP-glucuronic acid decarboxylase 1 isoform X3 n=1 Tax=Onychomys torridus TaxID=38674 RepID=UPI00167FCF28|nr:UDP-glucuronic acid decarboxylase 1 isoform X3 [Onychomys torridus]